jgi:hypothetical protein
MDVYRRLHCTYRAGRFDHWRVWAGAVSIEIDGLCFASTLARAYLRRTAGPPRARVRCELFVADVNVAAARVGDVAARVLTDAVDVNRPAPMRLCTDPQGNAVICGANFVFESEPFFLDHTGAFSYTVDISADQGSNPQWLPSTISPPTRRVSSSSVPVGSLTRPRSPRSACARSMLWTWTGSSPRTAVDGCHLPVAVLSSRLQ